MGLIQTASISLLFISLPWLCVCQPSDIKQTDGKTVVENAVDERTQISYRTIQDDIVGLPNTEVISFFNLATTVLLLAVVWIILGPILTGELVLVQARQTETSNLNARADNLDYGQGMYHDTLSDSASNLYKWWTEQYYPENSNRIDEYQTNYDHDIRQPYDAKSAENYDGYSESSYNDPYTSPYGYDWTNYDTNTYNSDEYNYNQYYGEGYNGEEGVPYYSEGRNFQFSWGGIFGGGIQTVNNLLQKLSGKAARAIDSLDILDKTFGVMNVDSEVCRQRTICEMERVASNNPIVSFFIKSVSPFVKGLEKYEDAVQQGRNGEDCALYYGECQYSLNKMPKFF